MNREDWRGVIIVIMSTSYYNKIMDMVWITWLVSLCHAGAV